MIVQILLIFYLAVIERDLKMIKAVFDIREEELLIDDIRQENDNVFKILLFF
jgi:hypothetical protein